MSEDKVNFKSPFAIFILSNSLKILVTKTSVLSAKKLKFVFLIIKFLLISAFKLKTFPLAIKLSKLLFSSK